MLLRHIRTMREEKQVRMVFSLWSAVSEKIMRIDVSEILLIIRTNYL